MADYPIHLDRKLPVGGCNLTYEDEDTALKALGEHLLRFDHCLAEVRRGPDPEPTKRNQAYVDRQQVCAEHALHVIAELLTEMGAPYAGALMFNVALHLSDG
jgi:hypothetical protein